MYKRQIWRSENVLDSPNPEAADRRYDGWGLHNAITSNMIVGSKDTLNFVAGFGYPFRTAENLPSTNPIVLDGDVGNFAWLQYGRSLSTKLENATLEGTDYWSACTQMAVLSNAEIGFSPRQNIVAAYLAANPSANVWEARSTIFMRKRAVGTGQLQTALTSGAVITTLALDKTDLKTFSSTGGKVIIDNEIITYTSATASGDTVTLTGTTRATDDSVAVDHLIQAPVYFVEKLIKDTDASLISVDSRSGDYRNLYNTIELNYEGGQLRKSDSSSVDQFGEITLSRSVRALNRFSIDWLEVLANQYLDRFKALKDVVDLKIPFTPILEIGEVIVLHTTSGIVSNFVPYEIMRFTHNLQTYQTTITMRQI